MATTHDKHKDKGKRFGTVLMVVALALVAAFSLILSSGTTSGAMAAPPPVAGGNTGKDAPKSASQPLKAVKTHLPDADGVAIAETEIRAYYQQYEPGVGMVVRGDGKGGKATGSPDKQIERVEFTTFGTLKQKLLAEGIAIPGGPNASERVAVATFKGDFLVGSGSINSKAAAATSQSGGAYHYSILYEIFDAKTGKPLFTTGRK